MAHHAAVDEARAAHARVTQFGAVDQPAKEYKNLQVKSVDG